MPASDNVIGFSNRDVRNARRSREDVAESAAYCRHMNVELRLTVMETRIRLAETMATLRRIAFAIDGRIP